MSKYSQYNLPLSTNEIFRAEARDFRIKRNLALRRSLTSSTDVNTLAILDGRAPGLTAFVASNFTARFKFARRISRDVLQLWQDDPDLQFLHVTIVNSVFETSDEQTVLNIKALTDQARDVLVAMAPDWIAAVELAVFANRRHPLGGKVISPHVHATLWGHNVLEEAESVAARYNARLSTGVAGCAAVKVQLVRSTDSDLERVAVYPYRAPVRAKTLYDNPLTGRTNLHESEKGDRYVRFLRQHQLHSMLEQDRLSFASGGGVAIRRTALAAVHRRLEKLTKRGSRQDQMGWIAEFWEEFMPRHNLGRFAMPQIILT